MRLRHVLIALLCSVAFAGCSSFGKGVTKAILEETKKEPDAKAGLCEITGQGYTGLREAFAGATPENPKTLRMLIIHGIGEHLPGYSSRYQRRLALRLGMTMVEPIEKTIVLRGAPLQSPTPSAPPVRGRNAAAAAPATITREELGALKISRYTDDKGKSLLTFEVTWSPITNEERKILVFDQLTATAKTRATLNSTLKVFMNEGFADPLAYYGPKGEKIRDSFVQSMCWATTNTWEQYPDTFDGRCEWAAKDTGIVARDAFVISSHSLGSRIAWDAMESLGVLSSKQRAPDSTLAAFPGKSLHFFMLSNQLPLLQIGRPVPQMTGVGSTYCGENAPKANERWFKEVKLVAFSDPNDLFTYEIPAAFMQSNFDSRMCADTTNISIKVAKEIDLAVSTFASPEVAHTKYEDDDRVLDLMAGGIASDIALPEGCDWLKFPEVEAVEK